VIAKIAPSARDMVPGVATKNECCYAYGRKRPRGFVRYATVLTQERDDFPSYQVVSGMFFPHAIVQGRVAARGC
jgi:hypothetical protein